LVISKKVLVVESNSDLPQNIIHDVETIQTWTQDALCCSKSGCLFAFEVSTGKDNTSEGSAYETVMRRLRDSKVP
jgi:hypothetical protein